MAIKEEFHDHSDELVTEWFEKRGIAILGRIIGDEAEDEGWLRRLGILNPEEKFIAARSVTQEFIGTNKNFGDGWHRGGAESFYKIMRIDYEADGTSQVKYIAFKSPHSLGNINDKVFKEAAWMSELSKVGRAGRVYAIGEGTIVKEFLIADDESVQLSADEKERQKMDIIAKLKQLGLSPLTGEPEVIQHGGRLFLVDLGSGDINGPSLSEFIENS